jgi:hypothetical protein
VARRNESLARTTDLNMIPNKTDVPFADEKSRIAYQIGEKIDWVARNLPPENPHAAAKAITFDPRHITPGTYAIFFSGTVVGTREKDVFVVPERTLVILEKLKIPFSVVSGRLILHGAPYPFRDFPSCCLPQNKT